MMSPIVPHLAEELWAKNQNDFSVHNQSWPQFDQNLSEDDEITLIIQINGKVRDKIITSPQIGEEEAKNIALNSDKVKSHIMDQKVRKIIFVPGKLINIVAN